MGTWVGFCGHWGGGLGEVAGESLRHHGGDRCLVDGGGHSISRVLTIRKHPAVISQLASCLRST